MKLLFVMFTILAAFLLHLAPEGKEVLASAWLTDSHIEYPVAELIMGAGFFLVSMPLKQSFVQQKTHGFYYDVDGFLHHTVSVFHSLTTVVWCLCCRCCWLSR